MAERQGSQASRREPRTMFEKIWDLHKVLERPDGLTLLYVDILFAHDGSGAAFKRLKKRGLPVHAPQRVFGTPDHYVLSSTNRIDVIANPEKRGEIERLIANAKENGITFFGLDDQRQGIVHVVGPEAGITQPGRIVVCGDSHTSTHGAVGALAFGIGSTEVTHVLATQTLWQRKPKTMRISVHGRLGLGVTGKDVILAIIAKIGAAGAAGHVIEYAGAAIRGLSMEGRLSLCNMSIEAGARAGMVAPDSTTFEYLHGRAYAPRDKAWDDAVRAWNNLPSDEGAAFDTEMSMEGSEIAPMVTWGISPEDALPISGVVPDPDREANAEKRGGIRRALDYMGLAPGTRLTDVAVNRVFIGSCTNGRIEDLRAAAEILRGRKVADGVTAWVVAGSTQVKLQAEHEGLDKIFAAAGFEWRPQAACSMCLGTNGEIGVPGERIASTTNRNFVGRQGPGVRTHLMSPAMAAAAAVSGKLADVRELGVVA